MQAESPVDDSNWDYIFEEAYRDAAEAERQIRVQQAAEAGFLSYGSFHAGMSLKELEIMYEVYGITEGGEIMSGNEEDVQEALLASLSEYGLMEVYLQQDAEVDEQSAWDDTELMHEEWEAQLRRLQYEEGLTEEVSMSPIPYYPSPTSTPPDSPLDRGKRHKPDRASSTEEKQEAEQGPTRRGPPPEWNRLYQHPRRPVRTEGDAAKQLQQTTRVLMQYLQPLPSTSPGKTVHWGDLTDDSVKDPIPPGVSPRFAAGADVPVDLPTAWAQTRTEEGITLGDFLMNMGEYSTPFFPTNEAYVPRDDPTWFHEAAPHPMDNKSLMYLDAEGSMWKSPGSWQGDIRALVDSGCVVDAISKTKVDAEGIPTMSVSSVFLRTINGGFEMVNRVANVALDIYVGGERCRILSRCYVMPNLPSDMVIGGNTLKHYSAELNFGKRCMTVDLGERSVTIPLSEPTDEMRKGWQANQAITGMLEDEELLRAEIEQKEKLAAEAVAYDRLVREDCIGNDSVHKRPELFPVE